MEKKEILLKLRQETGMNRREFAEYFGIPYRTVQEWELGHREMPGYLLRLMNEIKKFFEGRRNILFGENILIYFYNMEKED